MEQNNELIKTIKGTFKNFTDFLLQKNIAVSDLQNEDYGRLFYVWKHFCETRIPIPEEILKIGNNKNETIRYLNSRMDSRTSDKK